MCVASGSSAWTVQPCGQFFSFRWKQVPPRRQAAQIASHMPCLRDNPPLFPTPHLRPLMTDPDTRGLVLRGVVPPLRLRDFRLIAFDMDSTLINIECVDEIADAAGRNAEVAAITEAAMRGEISD